MIPLHYTFLEQPLPLVVGMFLISLKQTVKSFQLAIIAPRINLIDYDTNLSQYQLHPVYLIIPNNDLATLLNGKKENWFLSVSFPSSEGTQKLDTALYLPVTHRSLFVASS